MLYEKVYLIGNGRTADHCIRVLYQYRKDAVYLIVEEENVTYSQKFCERNGITYLCIKRGEYREFFLSITERTLIVSAHNNYVFPREVVEKENLRIINMHIAPLPLYRGMNAPTWEIFEGENYGGVTWHEVTAGIDDGGIICQRTFQIEEKDTAMKVLLKSFELGVKLLEEKIEMILTGEYKTYQPEKKTRLYLKKEMPNNGYMDINWEVKKKYAFLRSMDYSGTTIMPLPRIKRGEKEWEIWRYEMEEERGREKEDRLEETEECVEFYAGESGECLICWLREVVE